MLLLKCPFLHRHLPCTQEAHFVNSSDAVVIRHNLNRTDDIKLHEQLDFKFRNQYQSANVDLEDHRATYLQMAKRWRECFKKMTVFIYLEIA